MYSITCACHYTNKHIDIESFLLKWFDTTSFFPFTTSFHNANYNEIDQVIFAGDFKWKDNIDISTINLSTKYMRVTYVINLRVLDAIH